jgi:hypothetical protein
VHINCLTDEISVLVFEVLHQIPASRKGGELCILSRTWEASI